MTNKNTPSSCHVREYDGFEGIDRTRRSGGLMDVVNMRLENDKTLKRREAAVKLTSLDATPRAHYPYSESEMLLLEGRRVILLNMSTFAKKELGFVTSDEGDAQFFCYDGLILLIDGSRLYVCHNSGIEELEGYAPLYGKGWHPTKKGAVHEQLNLLSKHYRISYLVDQDNPTLFNLDFNTESIDAVHLNGMPLRHGSFLLRDDGVSITCNAEIKAGDLLTLFMSIGSTPYHYAPFGTCTRASTFGDADDRGADPSSIAFYGGSERSSIYCTRSINKDEFEEALTEYPTAMNIYVVRSERIVASDGTAPITATCRRGGNLLVFTSDSAFVLKESNGTAHMLNLSTRGGCTSPDGSAPMGDSPLTVSEAGILKWSPTRYDSAEYTATCISLPIGGLAHPNFHSSSVIYSCRTRNEIWFTDPHSSDKRVFVYNSLLDSWYSFCGIAADSFFEIGGRLGYFSGKDVFIFDDSAEADSDGSKSIPITVKISTGRITFGDYESKKRLFKLSMQTAPQNSFDLCVTDATGRSVNLSTVDRSGEQPGYIEERINASRSRHYFLTVTGRSATPEHLYGMTLTAAK